MWFLVIFLFELILLFIFSKKLIKSLSLGLYRITSSQSKVVNVLAVLFLPGTIMHELSHLLTAGVLLVPVGEISVLPIIEEKSIKLGSVQIGKVDPFRLTIVGVAPVILGLLSILGILYFAQISQPLNWWQIVLGLYLIFEISNTMFSSKRDLEGTIGFIVGILVVFLLLVSVLYFWKPDLVQNMGLILLQLNWQPVLEFLKLGNIYLLVPLILDLVIITFTSPFTKRY